MKCRKGCGACCIAISISSPIPGMPEGKPAGVRCRHLTSLNLCALFDSSLRPKICRKFKADPQFCGKSRTEAMELIAKIEAITNS